MMPSISDAIAMIALRLTWPSSKCTAELSAIAEQVRDLETRCRRAERRLDEMVADHWETARMAEQQGVLRRLSPPMALIQGGRS